VPAEAIQDWQSFHEMFKDILGFPEFYGRNMDAWIDCMRSIDAAEDGVSAVTVDPGEVLVLNVDDATDFRRRCPEQFGTLRGPISSSLNNGWR
jgi:RNAse (barnase) inhibitor barstar